MEQFIMRDRIVRVYFEDKTWCFDVYDQNMKTIRSENRYETKEKAMQEAKRIADRF